MRNNYADSNWIHVKTKNWAAIIICLFEIIYVTPYINFHIATNSVIEQKLLFMFQIKKNIYCLFL